MRHPFFPFALVLAALALACSGGSNPSRDTATALEAVAVFADAGVRCVHREPPPFHACDGLDAGAACSVGDEDRDGGEPGFCKALHDGRLVCAGADDDEEDSDPGECEGDGRSRDGGEHGQPCDAGVPGDDDSHADGGFERHDGGLSAPIQAAIDACAKHSATDPCSFTFRGRELQGACRQSRAFGVLICAPLCSQR